MYTYVLEGKKIEKKRVIIFLEKNDYNDNAKLVTKKKEPIG